MQGTNTISPANVLITIITDIMHAFISLWLVQTLKKVSEINYVIFVESKMVLLLSSEGLPPPSLSPSM